MYFIVHLFLAQLPRGDTLKKKNVPLVVALDPNIETRTCPRLPRHLEISGPATLRGLLLQVTFWRHCQPLDVIHLYLLLSLSRLGRCATSSPLRIRWPKRVSHLSSISLLWRNNYETNITSGEEKKVQKSKRVAVFDRSIDALASRYILKHHNDSVPKWDINFLWPINVSLNQRTVWLLTKRLNFREEWAVVSPLLISLR